MRAHTVIGMLLLAVTASHVQAFVTPGRVLLQRPTTTTTAPTTTTTTQQHMMMFDPAAAMEGVSSAMNAFSSSNMLLSFTDQGQNWAGIFFQASLLPYLLFLYFLSFRANRIPPLANYGFQFVLLFVVSTIPSGIISKSVYGETLANVDYLHGGAELLLTVANILIVLGLNQVMSNPNPSLPSDYNSNNNDWVTRGRNISLLLGALFVGTLVLGPSLLPAHAPFLGGIGNLPSDWVTLSLPWVTHNEPINALSIPTWAIHFSSVFEYLIAMNLVWKFSEATDNEAWKGLTWGMLPLHASGVCACTYHFFYNDPSLQFLVTTQAGLTLLGNLSCMVAAFRIAQQNAWKWDEINPLPRPPTSVKGLVADGIAAQPLLPVTSTTEMSTDTPAALAVKLIGWTLLSSYVIKYGELGLDLPFTANAAAATTMIVGIPAITAYRYYNLSQGRPGFALPSFGKNADGTDAPMLSMSDIKKFGVAGTVAYVLTELAFWIVAFPVAAVALYQSTGHWPNVVESNVDRAAVLAFIVAGANIARAFVPLRLGAALALAPWVDENLINRNANNNTDDKNSGVVIDATTTTSSSKDKSTTTTAAKR